MKHFVYGNRYRIFLNTSLGCCAKCKYCYLPELGLGDTLNYISAKEALHMFEQLEYFVPGEQGSILSFGCYSECWDNRNKIETMKLLSNLVMHGNYIQMATKQAISKQELEEIDALALYPGQIVLSLSIPTISHIKELEPGTALLRERLAPLQWKDKFSNIYFTLYIKPIIPSITLKDSEIYGDLMEKYQLPAIVGPLLAKGEGDVLVGEGALKEVSNKEAESLITMLKQHGEVYTHSTQIIDSLRL